MMSEITGYREEVQTIKTAILRAQYAAAKSANAQQLQLYFAVGGYVSANTRNGTWGKRAQNHQRTIAEGAARTQGLLYNKSQIYANLL